MKSTCSSSAPSGCSHLSRFSNESTHPPAILTNTGKVAGTVVVQLYIQDVVGSATRPVKELKGFEPKTSLFTLLPGSGRLCREHSGCMWVPIHKKLKRQDFP